MIYKATIQDIPVVAKMAQVMWSNHSYGELEQEFNEIISCDNAIVFILSNEDQPMGFAQCQLRYDYVEGTNHSPVGYLEGIFVYEKYRNNGYAKELLEWCERWASDKGCSEFASDCELTNDISLNFHLSMGFQEANRIICFIKKL